MSAEAGAAPLHQKRLELPVYGMTCEGCAATIRLGLGRLDGVERVDVDLPENKVVVAGEAGLDEAEIRRWIGELGYRLEADEVAAPGERPSWFTLALALAGAAAVVLLGTLLFREASASYLGQGGLASLNDVFDDLSAIAVGLAFLFGLVVAFAPSSYAMAPAVMGYVAGSGAASARQAARLSAAFLAGIVLIDMVVGGAFAAAGGAALRFVTARLPLWYAVVTVVLVVLALITLRLWRPRLPSFAPRMRESGGPGGAFLLGVPFGLLTCPACTPLLLPVALGAAASGEIWYGALLMGAFALGRGIPIAVLGTSTGAFERMVAATRLVPWVERAIGVLLLAAAAYFLREFFRVGGFGGLF